MDKVFLVTIILYTGVFGVTQISRKEAKVFSSESKAIEYLMESGFSYGKPYPFTNAGWYHSKIKKHVDEGVYDIAAYIVAKIEEVKIDQEVKYIDKLFFEAFISNKMI